MKILTRTIPDPYSRRGEIYRATLTLQFKEGRGSIIKKFDVFLTAWDEDDLNDRVQNPEVIHASLWPYRKKIDTSKIIALKGVELRGSAGLTVHPIEPVVEVPGDLSFHL